MNCTHRIMAFFAFFVLALSIFLAGGRADDNRLFALDVAVTDKDGNPVVGLTKQHFKLFEDDVEQTITEVGPTEKALAIVLLVEFSDGFTYYGEVGALAAGFIQSLQPKDWIAVVTYDVRPEIVTDFTRDRRALLDSLRRLQMPFYRETSLHDAVYFVLERLEDVNDKTAIVLLGTGLDTVSGHSFTKVTKKAEGSNSVIYSVGLAQFARTTFDPYGESRGNLGMLEADNVMRSLAEATGGLSFFPRFSGEYPEIFRTVGADLRNRYTLEYVSNIPASSKSRKLRVEVIDTDVNHDGKPDKLKVRHKKGRI